MASHSSTFAWKIPWMEEPGRLQSQTRLSDFTFTFHVHALEKEMATHSSVLAWRIPGTGEPGGLPSMGSHRGRHDWSDLAAAAAVPIKSTTTAERGTKGGGKKQKKKIQKNLQNKSKNKNIKYFSWVTPVRILSSTGNHSPPYLPRMPSNTVLISEPAVRAAKILIWSYSCVSLPLMSTAIRASAFSFVGALSGLLYIP